MAISPHYAAFGLNANSHSRVRPVARQQCRADRQPSPGQTTIVNWPYAFPSSRPRSKRSHLRRTQQGSVDNELSARFFDISDAENLYTDALIGVSSATQSWIMCRFVVACAISFVIDPTILLAQTPPISKETGWQSRKGVGISNSRSLLSPNRVSSLGRWSVSEPDRPRRLDRS